MTGKTHQMVGLGFGLGLVALAKMNGGVEIVPSVCVCAAASVGALLPDIDHTQSVAGKKVPFFSYPISWLNKGCNAISKKCSGVMKKFWAYMAKGFGHRGFCHAGLLWLVLTYLAYIYLMNPASGLYGCLVFGLAVGGLSHIVADTLNPSGIPWLLPLTTKRLSLAKISTSSGGEHLFYLAVCLINVLILWFGILQ